MKQYFILLLVFIIGCAGSKNTVKEKEMQDFQVQDQPEERTEVTQNSQSPSEKRDTNNTIETLSADITKIPDFKFSLVPSDTFNLMDKNELLLVIIGEGTADISLSWQDNNGNWKTVKKGSKIDKVYTTRYSAGYVEKNIGTGHKLIKAEIMYDSGKLPVQLQQDIYITPGKSTPAPAIKTPEVTHHNYHHLNLYFDDIYFDLGKYKTPSQQFNKNYMITLVKSVEALQQNDNIYLNLRGYTDPTGSPEINSKISRKRCETVGQMLLDLFPAKDREKMAARIFIMNMGVGELLAHSDNTLKNQLNRRVSLTLSDTPRGMSLLYALKKKDRDFVLSPHKIEKTYKQGLDYFYNKKFEEAAEIFKSIYEKYPNHDLADNAQWWEAEILYVNKNYSEAVELYNHVFGLGDGNKEAYAQYRVGCCYKEMKMYDKAVKELQKVNKLYPTAKEEWVKAQRMIKNIKSQ